MLSDSEEIVGQLRSLSNPEAVSRMARFGITGKKVLGVSISSLRKTANKIGRSHDLAQKLWVSGVREARILASMIDVLEMVTKKQMESWARDSDSWDVSAISAATTSFAGRESHTARHLNGAQ